MNFFGKNPAFYIDEVVYEDAASLGPRTNQCLQLVYVFDGEIEINCWCGEHTLQRGEAILLLPGAREFFRFASKTHHGWCEVRMPELPRETIEAYRSLNWPDHFSERLHSLHAIAMELPDRTTPASGALLGSIAQAIFHSFFKKMGFSPTPSRPLPPALKRSIMMIEVQYAENIKLDEIARYAGVSVQHLGRLFRVHLDSTPISLLWDTRIKEGIRLLENTGLNVAEIAYRSGFQNPYHFSRMIKQRLGVPPNRYRNQFWSGVKGAE